MNTIFRLVDPVCGIDTYIFKVPVFTKQANYEENPVFFPAFRAFNT